MLFKVNVILMLCFLQVSSFRDFQSIRMLTKRPRLEKLVANTDFPKYLEALNRIIDFSGEHKNHIDINLYFGIFLVNVNLKRALLEKRQILSKGLDDYIEEIIRKTEILLEFFKHSIDQNHIFRNNKYKPMFLLFGNATAWVYRLPKFQMTHFNESVLLSDLEKKYTSWNLYRKKIDDRNTWVPNPQQSDLCLASLATAEEVQIGSSLRCKVLKSCYEMVDNGTDFGYALAHRLLFLQQARFARGCDIFSEQEDRIMSRRFCSTAYQEAKYIALHNFHIVDLLLEHVCLCALEGYAQFLKPSWLTAILNFQTPFGCFSQISYKTYNFVSYKTPYSQPTVCKVPQFIERYLDGYCNGHTTAVAAGTLALASRFILQFYY